MLTTGISLVHNYPSLLRRYRLRNSHCGFSFVNNPRVTLHWRSGWPLRSGLRCCSLGTGRLCGRHGRFRRDCVILQRSIVSSRFSRTAACFHCCLRCDFCRSLSRRLRWWPYRRFSWIEKCACHNRYPCGRDRGWHGPFLSGRRRKGSCVRNTCTRPVIVWHS